MKKNKKMDIDFLLEGLVLICKNGEKIRQRKRDEKIRKEKEN
jgi:hypothetical protein